MFKVSIKLRLHRAELAEAPSPYAQRGVRSGQIFVTLAAAYLIV